MTDPVERASAAENASQATAVSVVIWRLNETAGVRHLRRTRDELISVFGEGESK